MKRKGFKSIIGRLLLTTLNSCFEIYGGPLAGSGNHFNSGTVDSHFDGDFNNASL